MTQNNNKPTNRTLIEQTHDKVNQLTTVLVGIPGTDDKGLVGEVKQNSEDIDNLYSKHGKLSWKLWTLIAVLTTSGVISVGELTELINLFGG